MIRSICRVALALLALSPSAWAGEAEIRIAVASNFIVTAKALAERFKGQSDADVTVVPGATGALYTQIVQGAPFDVFLAADALRPALLERQGYAVQGSRFTYARGRLVLWAKGEEVAGSLGATLERLGTDKLAIANPATAPYGRAAQQALFATDLWTRLQAQLVRGESVSQAYRFVASGNARMGLVALSQATTGKLPEAHWLLVPSTLHAHIDQQGVLLKEAGRDFVDFLATPDAHKLIESHGYEVH